MYTPVNDNTKLIMKTFAAKNELRSGSKLPMSDTLLTGMRPRLSVDIH
jgi:hypothetical protein